MEQVIKDFRVVKGSSVETKAPSKEKIASLVQGFAFGTVFGFLLQRGGVAKYEVLLGALLLKDFTVMKVMLTAILVGSIGIFALSRAGALSLKLKPTRYAANVLGGLIFGIGFAVYGYCPGTGAAALGQGNLDAAIGIPGLMAGSYLFALFSRRLDETIMQWGYRGRIQLPDLIGVSVPVFLVGFLPLLALVLFFMERWGGS